jgi:hypothetical protein
MDINPLQRGGVPPSGSRVNYPIRQSQSHPNKLNWQFLREPLPDDSQPDIMVVGATQAPLSSGSSSALPEIDFSGPTRRSCSYDSSLIAPRKKVPNYLDSRNVQHWLKAEHHLLEIEEPGSGPVPHTQFKNDEADKTVLILHKAGNGLEPFRFRTTTAPFNFDPDINLAGFADVMMSGCASISSVEQIEFIKKEAAGRGAKKVVLIDARQEPHAALQVGSESYDATLFSIPNNLANMGFSNKECIERQSQWMKDFEANHGPLVMHIRNDELRKYVKGGPDEKACVHRTLLGNRIKIKTVKELAESCGAGYLQLFIPDRQRMSDDMLESLINCLQKNSVDETFWAPFCKGGRGRTTQVMSVIDMFLNVGKSDENGKILTLRDFIQRIEKTGANLLIPAKNGKADRQTMREDRGLFLCCVHAYFERYPQGKGKTWREFLAEDAPHLKLDFSAEMKMVRGEVKTWAEADAACLADAEAARRAAQEPQAA